MKTIDAKFNRTRSSLLLLGLSVCGWLATSAVATTGGLTATASSASRQFNFSSQPIAGQWNDAAAAIALPENAYVSFHSLAEDGTVLVRREEAGEQKLYRWNRGTLAPIGVSDGTYLDATQINEKGDVLVRYYRADGSGPHWKIINTAGNETPVDAGPFGVASFSGFSGNYLTGSVMMSFDTIDTGEGSYSIEYWVGAKWTVGTPGFQQLGQVSNRQNALLVKPRWVNAQGDYLAEHVQEGPNGDSWVGYYLNDQPLDPAFQAYGINSHGDVLVRDTTDYSILVLRADGNLDLVTEFGSPVAINDRGDVLVDDWIGTAMLWRKSELPNGSIAYNSTDLDELTGKYIQQTFALNNAGEVLFYSPDDSRYLLLTGSRLDVDFNRDGAIDTSGAADNPDRTLALKQLPWFFWVNDDNDAEETDGNDIPGGGENGQDGRVNGVRDLVDFFPVYLDIAALLQAHPATDPTVAYRLVQAEGAANFLATDLEPGTAGNYLRDPEKARALAAATVVPVTAQGVALSADFLGRILSDGQGIILVEARKEAVAPLRLEVTRSGLSVAVLELPLKFAGVETMFRHRNLVGAVGVKVETADRSDAPNWPESLNNRQAFVFVHGYNVNQKSARGWQAEFFKRLWWTGSNAEFWGATWYGTESQVTLRGSHVTSNYQANVIHAFGTAPRLAEFINELKAAKAGDYQINVAGHSLGNMVVSSAISDYGAEVARYFMVDAAVAAEAYDGAAPDATGVPVLQPEDATADMPHSEWNKGFGGVYPAKLWAGNWYQLFNPLPGDQRSKLTWRDRFRPQAGVEYYDFHSTGEEVLDHTDSPTPSLTFVLLQTAANTLGEKIHFDVPFIGTGQPAGHKSWQYQEQLKGRTITGKVLGSNFGGWGFNTLHFKKSPSGAGGKGPILIPAVLLPDEISTTMLNQVFTPEVLREEPFFRPGGAWRKVGSWKYNTSSKTNSWQEDRLGLLYDPATGSEFASRHRTALLARMIPAMSPAAGRIAVPQLTADAGVERNFDMNGALIRPRSGQNPPWPASRGQDFRWWHSDLREVAYPYVKGLYAQLVTSGDLDQVAP